jgi:stage V sporulation protein SpoVS
VYTVTIVVPASAPSQEVKTFSTNFVAVAAYTPAQLNVLFNSTFVAAGVPNAQVLSVSAKVNGVPCTGAACNNLITQPSPPGIANVGAIVGGVVGGAVAIVIIVLAVRRGYLESRRKQLQAAPGSQQQRLPEATAWF